MILAAYNDSVAQLLRDMAAVLEAQQANPFRVNAYRRAAQTVAGLDVVVVDLQLGKRIHSGIVAEQEIRVALLGVGHITVVDFDEIEESNLTRSVLYRSSDCGRRKVDVAVEAVQNLNPDVQARPICGSIITDVGLGMFLEADVVIGCLDNREARLWVNRCCWKVNTPWIDGGIQEINGVAKVFQPPDGACYECAMTENDYRLINLRYSCPLLRQEDLQAGRVPTAPTIASMIGGLQTQEALKLIHRSHREVVQEGVEGELPPIGVMVEVPAAVYQARAMARRVGARQPTR